jgi:hypothetical protein
LSARAAALVLAAFAAFAAAASASDPAPALKTLSDADLLTLATQMKAAKGAWPAAWHSPLGLHNGTRIVLTTRCSDVCPIYTTTVIHYDVEGDAACQSAHGVIAPVLMPQGIAMTWMDFCVPALLRDAKLIAFTPYRNTR